MKRVLKSPEPQSLADFRVACPCATWEEMRNDSFHNGQQAYKDCSAQTRADQHALCAYCESRLDLNKPHACRVEHVHPKSDTSTGHNWNLDWQNLLATCNGGETEDRTGKSLADVLSCDAHKKNFTINVNPLDIPAFPNVFAFDESTGHLMPEPAACAQASLDADGLKQTIGTLNLNCNRLARHRKAVAESIEQRKEILRNKGYSPQKGLLLLAQSYFQIPWPEFFTTIRCCLGQSAEKYLRSVKYTG